MTEVTTKDITDAGEMIAEGPVDTGFKLHVFTNDKTNPIAIKQLEMVYQAVVHSRIGLMHAKNIMTGKVETLLVGIEFEDGGVNTYPISKLLGEEDMNIYLPPDGNGGYIGETVEETSVN